MMKNEELRALRKSCRITIVALSEITGVSQKDISLYEQGLAPLADEKVNLLFRTLKCPMGFSDN